MVFRLCRCPPGYRSCRIRPVFPLRDVPLLSLPGNAYSTLHKPDQRCRLLYLVHVHARHILGHILLSSLFPAVLGTSITRSGVLLLPITIGFPVFAAIGGAIVGKTGRYKPVHIFSGATFTIGVGVSAILNQNTHTAVFAVLEVIVSVGMGFTVSSTLQAIQAGLPESEVGSSTGTWSFVRSLGTIWGVAIPAAIFNNRFDQLSGQIDLSIRGEFTHGQAYQNANAGFINSFPVQFRPAIIDAYVGTLRRVWLIAIVFTASIFLAAFFEKEIELRTELDTEYGLKGRKKEKTAEEIQETGESRC
jgi:MFS family permease